MRDVNAVKKASADTCRVPTHFNRAVESFWPHGVADMKSALLVDPPRTSDDDRLKSRCQYEELVPFRRLIVGAVCIWQDCWNLLQTCKRKSAAHQPYFDHVSLDVSSIYCYYYYFFYLLKTPSGSTIAQCKHKTSK